MPSNNNFGANFTIDVTQLKSGLAQANRLIRESESQFRAAASGMDDWTKSEEGLNAKIKSLNDITSIQQKKVDALTSEYDRLIAEGMDPTSKQAVDLRTKINNETTALNKNLSELDKQKQALKDMAGANDEAISAADKLRRTISDQESKLAELREEYLNTTLEQGKSSRAAKELKSEIDKLNGELEDNKNKLNQVDNAAEDVGDGFTIAKGAIAGFISNTLTALASSLKECVGYLGSFGDTADKAFNSFAASTGTATEDMAQFEDAIKNIYNNNFGDSFQDIADSMALIKQQSGDIGSDELERMTQNAIMLRDTFGFEVSESMRAVNELMKQFGITSDEAYNLIAQGAQNGLNQNDDLLDTINEYSVHYKMLGLTSEEFFNSLASGAQSGTFSIDKLGDAVKEFGIRVKDGSDGTAAAFEYLGYDADALFAAFNEGGADAAIMTQILIDELADMPDSVEKTTAGVALFGTMWEDLGANTIGSLAQMRGSISQTTDALSAINGVKYNTVGEALSGIQRNLETGILMPISEKILPKLNDLAAKFSEWLANPKTQQQIEKLADSLASFADGALTKVIDLVQWVIDNKDTVIAGLAGIGAAFGAFKVVGVIQSVIGALKGMSLAQAALNVVMAANPIGLVVAAVAGLVAAFVVLWNKCDAFREFWINLWEGIKSAFFTVVDFIKQNWQAMLLMMVNPLAGIFKLLYDNFEGFRNVVDNVLQFIKDLFSSTWEGIKFIWSGVAQWFSDSVIEPIKQFFSPLIDFFTSLWDVATELAQGCWNAIVLIWGIVSEWFNTNVITPVSNFFKVLWSMIKNAAGTAWNGIKSIWNAASTWFTNTIINPVKNVFTGLWNTLKSGASKAWEGIKSVFSSVAKFFGDIFGDAWKKVKDVFSTGGKIFDGIKDGIVDAFKNIVNSIIKGINKVVAIPFNGINSALDKIQNVSIAGVKPFSKLVSRIDVPEIPLLAKGGVVRRATAAVLGENGREAVLPLDNNTEWMKLLAKEIAAEQKTGVNVYQTNTYSAPTSRLQLWKNKRDTEAALRLALVTT